MWRRKGALGRGEGVENSGEISSVRSEVDVELVAESRVDRTSPEPIWPLVLSTISKLVSK